MQPEPSTSALSKALRVASSPSITSENHAKNSSKSISPELSASIWSIAASRSSSVIVRPIFTASCPSSLRSMKPDLKRLRGSALGSTVTVWVDGANPHRFWNFSMFGPSKGAFWPSTLDCTRRQP